MNQLECLDNAYKSDKIERLFCLLASYELEENEDNVQRKLILLMYTPWTKNDYIVTYQGAVALAFKRMLFSLQNSKGIMCT